MRYTITDDTALFGRNSVAYIVTHTLDVQPKETDQVVYTAHLRTYKKITSRKEAAHTIRYFRRHGCKIERSK